MCTASPHLEASEQHGSGSLAGFVPPLCIGHLEGCVCVPELGLQGEQGSIGSSSSKNRLHQEQNEQFKLPQVSN